MVSYTVHARRFEGTLEAPKANEAETVTLDGDLAAAEEWAQRHADAGWRVWLHDDLKRPMPGASPLRVIAEWQPYGKKESRTF